MKAVFTSSAFRHGYTKQDFYELLAADYLKIRSQRGLDEVYELLGRNLTRRRWPFGNRGNGNYP
jgi:hypothetical protein